MGTLFSLHVRLFSCRLIVCSFNVKVKFLVRPFCLRRIPMRVTNYWTMFKKDLHVWEKKKKLILAIKIKLVDWVLK